MLAALLTFFFVGLIALVLFGVALAAIGMIFSVAFGIAGFLLFKVAPILLIGWVILKLIQRSNPPPAISAADRRWLDESRD